LLLKSLHLWRVEWLSSTAVHGSGAFFIGAGSDGGWIYEVWRQCEKGMVILK